MIFAPVELAEIAEMEQGSLHDIPFAVLLFALARAEKTVILEISRKPLSKEIIVEKGVPVECRSNLVHETLSRFMMSSGRLDEATATSCFNESCSRGVRFGDVLIEKGIVTAEELLKVLQQNLAKKLLDGFSWRDGEFRLSGQPEGVDSNLKVNIAQLIIIGVTRFATQDQIDASIGGLIGKALALNPGAFFPIEEIKLSAAQQPLVQALSQQNLRVDELATTTGIPYADLTRVLYGLTLIGNVITEDQLPALKKAPSPHQVAALPQRPARKTEAPVSDEVREELMRLVLNHRRLDAFELLGLDDEARMPRIESSFLDFAENFAPWRFESALADKAKSVFMAGVKAYGTLSDPDKRRTLVESRTPVDMPKARGGSGDQFRISTNLLDPEVQFKKGMALVAKGDFRGALVQLEYAVNLDSQNARYLAEMAYCRFKTSPETQARAGLIDLQKALRIDARCGIAMYYAGEILRFQGRLDEAEDVLKKAIKPMAPDRRPIDTLHKIRAER